MVRTQIQLTNEQARRLRAWAAEHGVSLAEAIRRCVNQILVAETVTPEERYARASRLVGSLTDPEGASDLSSEHDAHLDRALD